MEAQFIDPRQLEPEIIEVQRPRCPNCGSSRLLAYKTRHGGDGTTTRHTRCEACGRRVHLVFE